MTLEANFTRRKAIKLAAGVSAGLTMPWSASFAQQSSALRAGTGRPAASSRKWRRPRLR